MRRLLALLPVLAACLALALPSAAQAGSAHFVGSPAVTTSGSTITVTAKEAGLGGLAQIHVVLAGTAECVNGGGNHPSAANKASFATAADEPVQNGMSTYTLSATVSFSPACSPPMSVVFTSATLTDTTNGISETVLP